MNSVLQRSNLQWLIINRYKQCGCGQIPAFGQISPKRFGAGFLERNPSFFCSLSRDPQLHFLQMEIVYAQSEKLADACIQEQQQNRVITKSGESGLIRLSQ